MTDERQTDLLGEIVAWDMGSMEVSVEKVRMALDVAGLSADWLKELRNQTGFTRACKEFKENRTIDKVSRDDDVVRFQFTTKHLQSLRLDFTYECQVTLNTATGMIDCPESYEIEAHARTLFAHAMAHRTTSDITRMVQTMFKTNGDLFPISRKGVAYFVPVQFRDFTERVHVFLQELGGSLSRFPVPTGTKTGNISVKEAVERGLTDLVEELRLTVTDWDDTTRTSTMDKAIERWTTLKYKAEVYSEYLGEQQAQLLDNLRMLKAELAGKVCQLADAKEAATTAGAAA